MSFRTRQMYRERERREEPDNSPHHGYLSGRGWEYQPGDENCDPCYTRLRRPGTKRPPEAMVSTPAPEDELREAGYRLDWFFLVKVLVFLGVLYALYCAVPADELVWATMGVC